MILKKFSKLIFLISSISIGLLSYASTSAPIEAFYEAWAEGDDYLLLDYKDSSFIYCRSDHYVGADYKEIGLFRVQNDTFLLTPKHQYMMEKPQPKCKMYDCYDALYMAFRDNKRVENYIKERVYIRKGKDLNDVSLKYYYPNDSNTFDFYKQFYPLYKQKMSVKKICERTASNLMDIYLQDTKNSRNFLFFDYSDTSYVYSKMNLSNNVKYYEIGLFKNKKDSVLLFPVYHTDNHAEWIYSNNGTVPTLKESWTLLQTPQEYRSYKKNDNKIQFDENTSIYESVNHTTIPLVRMRIKRSRFEKKVMRYRKMYKQILLNGQEW